VRYPNGQEIEPGDLVRIDEVHTGRVIANMDTGKYLPGEEAWSDLKTGIVVNTSFAGHVHYQGTHLDDALELIERAAPDP
jgi:hypothetical protein